MKKSLVFSFLLLALAITAGCGKDGRKKVALLEAPPTPAAIRVGSSVILQFDGGNIGPNIEEIILHEVAVTPAGTEIKGVTLNHVGRYGVNFATTADTKPGKYTIAVTSAGDRNKTVSVVVTVVPNLRITPATKKLAQGKSEVFKATGIDEGVHVVWTIDNNALGEIDQTGVFTAFEEATGIVTITATIVDATTNVTVKATARVTIVEPSPLFAWTKIFPMMAAGTYGNGSVSARPWTVGGDVLVNVTESNLTTFSQKVVTIRDGSWTESTGAEVKINPDAPVIIFGSVPKLPNLSLAAFGYPDSIQGAAVRFGDFNYGVSMEWVPGGWFPSQVIKLNKWDDEGTVTVAQPINAIGAYPKVILSRDKSKLLLGYTDADSQKLVIVGVDPDTLDLTATTDDGYDVFDKTQEGWEGIGKLHFADMIYVNKDNYAVVGTIVNAVNNGFSITYNQLSSVAFGKKAGEAWQMILDIADLDTYGVAYVANDIQGRLIFTGVGASGSDTKGFVMRTTDSYVPCSLPGDLDGFVPLYGTGKWDDVIEENYFMFSGIMGLGIASAKDVMVVANFDYVRNTGAGLAATFPESIAGYTEVDISGGIDLNPGEWGRFDAAGIVKFVIIAP